MLLSDRNAPSPREVDPRASRARHRARARSTFALVLAAALLPTTVPAVAWAQKTGAPTKADLERAKKLFFEGVDLEQEGNWSEALERFEAVAQVRMTPSVRFHIALCKEHMGKLVEALREFELAEADAKAEKVDAVLKEAPEHIAAIKPRIPKISVRVPDDVEGLSVTLDGEPIDPKGSDEILVNPGSHQIEATAEKRQAFTKVVTVAEGESKSVLVEVPLIGEDAPSPKKDESTPTPVTPPSSSGPPTLALVAGGVGVLSLLAAGGFSIARSSVKSDLDDACGEGGKSCPPDREGAISSGRTYTTLTNVFLVLGAVGVGAGVVLWVTAPKPSEKTPQTSLRLVPSAPGANVAGFSLSARF